MELRLLGPVQARVGDTAVHLGPRQQRLVMAMLAWDVNRVVPIERLVECLWPGDPPRTATHAVQAQVSNLRSILAKAGVDDAEMAISTEGLGYLLRADPLRIDLHRFLEGIARAQAAPNDRTKVALLDQALQLWTGPALADAAPPEVRERLCGGVDETRLVGMEDRFDAVLRLGGHHEVLGEITTLVDAHPTRERLISQLMLALHRSGQTSRALEVARRTRAVLAEELGIDPGADIQRLELAILRDDRCLDPVAPRPEGLGIPTRRTRLIGRDHDVADIVDGLLTGGTRLMTLTGPGGVGKTRLALEATRRLEAHVGDGMAVASLAPVGDPNLVLPTIASSLSVREVAGVPLRTTLQTHLRDRDLLLLIDNVEHLLDAVPDIAWLLDVCPGLTVLATSRAPLRLSGERVRLVGPLDARSAVELFTERALLADSAHDGLDPAVVGEICCRVDRLPLGIELAAARTRLLPPAALLDQLDQSHDLLSDGARDLPPRQRALRATIAWSYDLLTTDEQTMLHAVAVFAGGWTAPAAAAVAELDLTTALRLLGGLLDASLISRWQSGDEIRFTLLETVRHFALAQARGSGVLSGIRDRHAAYVEAFVSAVREKVEGPDQRVWFDRLLREHDNLRAAMRWLLDQGLLDRCASVLVFPAYWIISGRTAEYRQWAREALAGGDGLLSVAARAGVLALYGFALSGSDREQAIRVADEAVSLARRADDLTTLAMALLLRGHVVTWSGDDELAEALFGEAETAFRRLGSTSHLAATRAARAHVTMLLGRPREADHMLAELEVERRRAGGSAELGITLVYRGVVLVQLGDWEQAELLAREAVTIMNQFGAGSTMWQALDCLCITAAYTGRAERSARLAGAAALLVEQLGELTIHDLVKRSSQQAIAKASAEIGQDAFDKLFHEGHAMTWSQAVILATSTS